MRSLHEISGKARSSRRQSFRSWQLTPVAIQAAGVINLFAKEAVMDDSRDAEARMPQNRRYVPEIELLESLNRSLWEIERKRAEERVDGHKR
jgi:hypothetical protein